MKADLLNENFLHEEITLIRRARAGDREAFGQLMETHAPRAYRIAFAILRNQSDAEDTVQEAFITAYKSIKKLEKEGSFVSWLSRIVATRAYDLLRKRQRERKAVEATISIHKTAMSHNPAESRQDFALDLHEAITRLPELHRLVIMLHYSEDASTDEIARTLNRPVGTVRRILSESYRLLRLYLEGGDR
ncbi:MAG: ECF RNA polymerase sigma factor SigW [Dehalococcoidia bacterium]|nr:ECF RNA polymerase sigma factor SigW [Chloroflexota bacterium]